MDDDVLKTWQDIVEVSFIPKACAVGVLGNLINFVILSRSSRSSTNVYLTILAFVDAFFLLFVYVLSKQYHHGIHHQDHEIYWRMFGLTHWFYTAFLYITCYLTVSLAFDRFFAVRQPKSTARCSITRAKNVVSIIFLVCFLFSISAAFEFQLVSVEYKNEEMCRSNQSQVFENVTIATISSESSVSAKYHDNEIALNPVDHNDSYNLNKDENKMPFERLGRSLDNDVLVNEFNATDDDSHYPELDHKTSHNTADVDHYVNDVTARSSHSLNHNTCHSHFNLYPKDSALAKNKFYVAIFKTISSLLSIIPVGILTIIFITLTSSVYSAYKLRKSLAQLPMTAENPKRCDILIRENKITLLVITLVVIFLICHTPNAVYLVYKLWWSSRHSSSDEMKMENFIIAFKHLSNLLMAINGSCKIFVYLLIYDEYWTSLKRCYRCTNAPREQIIGTSKNYFPSTKADVENLLNYSLTQKRYSTQIQQEARHYHRASLIAQPSAAITIPRKHKESISSLTPYNSSVTPRLSLTTSEADAIEMNYRLSQPSTSSKPMRNPSTRSSRSAKVLHLCPSQASITRSKSLNIQSSIKHSPNCRHNKKVNN